MKLREKSPLWRRVVRALGRKLFRLAENNDDARVAHNGEEWLLRQLLGKPTAWKRPLVIFDVGGNVGDYTDLVFEIAGKAACPIEVHVFEPAPYNIERLRSRFRDRLNTTIVPAAVGASAGEATLYAGTTGSTLASLVPREVLGAGVRDVITVPVVRLDQYMDQAGIEHVDFLKLDVEGFELSAIRGLGSALERKSVDVIQFEYGGTTLDAGATLRQIFDVLTQSGYRVAKLFPAALELREYYVGLEHYTYANYVALSPKWMKSRQAGE